MHPQTPDVIVARLDQAYRKALQSDAAQRHNNSSGGQAWPSDSPAAFAEQLRADLEIERAIVRRLNLTPG
jgi:tripartite-type tricarboxylate transporter receptor subunit TctC